jgi:arginine-tRNA-protein transferase
MGSVSSATDEPASLHRSGASPERTPDSKHDARGRLDRIRSERHEWGRVKFAVVQDGTEACPYLAGRVARMPLRLPLERIDREGFDQLLAQGDRRFGPLLYRTRCPDCAACEPIRVPTAAFRMSKSQRRVWKRSANDVRVEVGLPAATPRHLELFDRHKRERGLARNEAPTTEEQYRFHLVDTCVDTREVRYFVRDELVAVSILDVGRTSASSVYHYFDPDEESRALGVYSVLWEIEWCRRASIDWYYLGLYVADCRSLAYKAQYRPHQRRVGGEWIEGT